MYIILYMSISLAGHTYLRMSLRANTYGPRDYMSITYTHSSVSIIIAVFGIRMYVEV